MSPPGKNWALAGQPAKYLMSWEKDENHSRRPQNTIIPQDEWNTAHVDHYIILVGVILTVKNELWKQVSKSCRGRRRRRRHALDA